MCCILQAALTQLIQYYHRFQKILSQHPFKRLPIRSELINIHHVMVEVKKHKTAFWINGGLQATRIIGEESRGLHPLLNDNLSLKRFFSIEMEKFIL